MDIDVKVSASMQNIIKEQDNHDLTLVNASWNKELVIDIHNPYIFSNENIRVTEIPQH